MILRERILIVDDDELLLRSIKMLLWNENYSVASANTGEEALGKIKEEPFDVMVIDIRMPGLDGIEVLKKVKEIYGDDSESQVIIMTGYASEDAPIKAIKYGAVDYIMKPFETADFLHSIKRALELLKLKKEKTEYIKQLEDTNKKLETALRELRHMKGREKLD